VATLNGVSLQYDAFGRRTKNAAGTSFLYSGSNVIQELSGSTVTANLLSGGVDEVFSRSDSSGVFVQLKDALGSTVALVDSNGNLTTQYSYDPFGNTTTTGPPSHNPSQYSGRENEGNGLYFYRSRYYSPLLHRFISQDPIGFFGGINMYAYVGNSPTNLRDPSGLLQGGGQGEEDIEEEEYEREREREENALEPVLPEPPPLPKPEWEKTLEKLSPEDLMAIERGACPVNPEVERAVEIREMFDTLLYRAGWTNRSSFKLRPGETAFSFRNSLSNPIVPGEPPVFKIGSDYVVVDITLLPRGAVRFDNVPPGHVSVTATYEEIRPAIIDRGTLPK
jgi:RHS repeat-associated protein